MGNKQTCASSFTFREVSAVTRLVPSSGRSSPTSTVSTLPVPTTVTPTSSSSVSTCTTMRPPAVATCLAPSLWTSSLVPWTLFVPAHSVGSSAPTTLSSARLVLVTTGQRVTTPRVPSSSTPCSTSSLRWPTLLSSLTTPPSLSTSWSRTPTSACALTTRPCTTSASVPSSSPPLPTATSTTCAPPACLASLA